jgi:hypothetical protein
MCKGLGLDTRGQSIKIQNPGQTCLVPDQAVIFHTNIEVGECSLLFLCAYVTTFPGHERETVRRWKQVEDPSY